MFYRAKGNDVKFIPFLCVLKTTGQAVSGARNFTADKKTPCVFNYLLISDNSHKEFLFFSPKSCRKMICAIQCRGKFRGRNLHFLATAFGTLGAATGTFFSPA